jgi:hypothetical protein
MSHARLLAEFQEYRRSRGQMLVTVQRGETTLYFAGMAGFIEDRDAATRFNRPPHDILRRHPQAKTALA